MAEQKQDKPKNPNDYELLEIEETATLMEVRSAYKKLALIWAPDHYRPSKLYPPDQQTQTLEEVQQKYALIQQAHTNLVEKLSSSSPEQKNTKEEKLSLPRDEAQFLQFLEDRANTYTSFMYTKLHAASIEVKKNIWKLIKAKRLSYKDLETTGEADTEFLWIVYRNSELVDFINNHVPRKTNDQTIVSLIELKKDYLEERKNSQVFTYLDESWESTNAEENIGEHTATFLLYLLNRATNISRFNSNFINIQISSLFQIKDPYLNLPFHLSNLNNPELPIMRNGAKWLMGLTHDYLSGQKKITLKEFRQQIIFGSHIFFDKDLSLSHSNIKFNYNMIWVEIDRLKELQKNNFDSKTQQRIELLKKRCKIIEDTLIYEYLNWIKEYEKDPESWLKLMAKDVPLNQMLERLEPVFYSENFENFEKWIAELKAKLKEPIPLKKSPPPQVGTLESMHNYFLNHPIKTSTGSLTLITALVCGGIALEKYLQNENVYQWLRQDVGMKTTADLSVLMAGIILILFIAAMVYAKKAASDAQKISPIKYEAKDSLPASEPICSIV